MKRTRTFIWLLTATILAFSLVDIGFAFQNEPEGFRDLKWGDPLTENMVLVDQDEYGLMKVYELPNERLYLGKVELSRVLYHFFTDEYNERFMQVVLHFKGRDNYELLKIICREKFGPETHKMLQSYKSGWYIWDGRKAYVSLYYSSALEEAVKLDVELDMPSPSRLSLEHVDITIEYLATRERKQIEEAEKDW